MINTSHLNQALTLIRSTFTFFGLFQVPENVGKKVETSKIVSRIVSAFWTFCHVYILYYVIQYPKSVFFADESLGMSNDILKYATTNIAYFAILLESIINEKKIAAVFEKLHKFETNCRYFSSDLEDFKRTFVMNYILKVFVIMIMIVIFNAILVYGIFNLPQWFMYWKITVVSLPVCKLRHIQLLYFAGLMNCYLSVLENELKIIKKESKTDLHFTGNKKCLEKMEAIKAGHGILWDASNFINDSFTWSVSANFVHDFTQIACDLCWMLSGLDDDHFLGKFDKITLVTRKFPGIWLMQYI